MTCFLSPVLLLRRWDRKLELHFVSKLASRANFESFLASGLDFEYPWYFVGLNEGTIFIDCRSITSVVATASFSELLQKIVDVPHIHLQKAKESWSWKSFGEVVSKLVARWDVDEL